MATNYDYTDNVPASQNNPSIDQPKMKKNTKSIKDLIGEDHITFNAEKGGFHKKSRYFDTVGFPTGLESGIGTVYTKLAISTGVSKESDLFYVADAGAPTVGPPATLQEYQLTRTITASFPQFSTNVTYGAPPFAGRIGGWTFLPGGMLLQYGKVITSTRTITTPFPVAFTNVVFSVTATAITNPGASVSSAGTCTVNAFTPTSFTTKSSNDSDNLGFFWMAIGK